MKVCTQLGTLVTVASHCSILVYPLHLNSKIDLENTLHTKTMQIRETVLFNFAQL